MSRQFLDLSDDTLRHIANYVHGDNDIPLPSFNPHWANFQTDINPEIHQDYLSLRSTCRKLRGLCPLKGIHVRLSTHDLYRSILSRDSKRAVRRMIINLPSDHKSPLSERRSQYSPNRNVSWSIFIDFLTQFPSLEELVIINSPLCDHGSVGMDLSKLSSPQPDVLPNLKSLAIETRCSHCAKYLPRLLAPISANIQHLKLWEDSGNINSLRAIKKEWTKRHPGASFSLQTVAVGARWRAEVIDITTRIAGLIPTLTELHVIRFERPFEGQAELTIGFFLEAKK